MVGGTAQPFHPIGDSNTDAFQSLCLHTFSGQHPDATGIARDSLSLTGPSLLSRATHQRKNLEFRMVSANFQLWELGIFLRRRLRSFQLQSYAHKIVRGPWA